jgi:molybdopterin synthase catalytic subunit
MIDIKVTSELLEPQKCLNQVADAQAGGTVQFIGTVRNQTQGKPVKQLEFEGYVPMAEKEMRKIAEHIVSSWKALHVSIHHQLGILNVGDVPVVITVSAPHRKAAFEACQYAIDTLKETVPIWKKEIFEDGEVWVAAHP